jgi:hypothetical protein
MKAARATLAADLANVPAGAWAEITVKLDAPEPDLDRQVREAAAGRFEVLKVLADLPASETALLALATHRPSPSATSSPATCLPRTALSLEKQLEGEELRGRRVR